MNLSAKEKEILFFKNIYSLGYRYFKTDEKSKDRVKVVKAFQRRFNPKNITGNIDLKTLKISANLLYNLKNP